jgi:hypothetical protein
MCRARVRDLPLHPLVLNMEGDFTTLFELLALQSFLSLPVIVGASAFTVYYLRKHQQRDYSYIVMVCLAMAVSAVPTATVIWVYWPLETDIMVADFVNLPAVAAYLVLTPVTVWFAALGAKWA